MVKKLNPNTMSDQIIASDLNHTAKAGVRNLAWAITETTSPEVRSMLTQRFNEAVRFQEQVSSLMQQRGWYNPHDIQQQLNIDMQFAQTSMNLQS